MEFIEVSGAEKNKYSGRHFWRFHEGSLEKWRILICGYTVSAVMTKMTFTWNCRMMFSFISRLRRICIFISFRSLSLDNAWWIFNWKKWSDLMEIIPLCFFLNETNWFVSVVNASNLFNHCVYYITQSHFEKKGRKRTFMLYMQMNSKILGDIL